MANDDKAPLVLGALVVLAGVLLMRRENNQLPEHLPQPGSGPVKVVDLTVEA